MLDAKPMSAEGHLRDRSSPKVRSGCITCKRRRVKCDERRPTCGRCEKASIACAGYVNFIPTKAAPHRQLPAQQQDQLVSTSSSRTSSTKVKDIYIFYRGVGNLPGLKSDEIDAFDYCRRCTLAELDSIELADMWQSAVPAASHSEPAIFHALSALGLAHRAFTQRQDRRAPPDNRLATRSYSQYGKAVHNLQKRLKDMQAPPLAVVLIACFVLLTFDIVSERYTSALSHLHHAGNIIQTLQRDRISSHSKSPSASTDLLDKLVCTFDKLSANAPSWGESPKMWEPFCAGIGPESVSKFKSSHEASDSLAPIMNRAVIFTLKQGRQHALQLSVIDPSALVEQSQILSDLSHWHSALQNSSLLNCIPKNTNNIMDSPHQIALLQIHHALCVFMITTSLDPYNEMLHDNLFPSYNTIITQAAAVLPNFPSLYLDRTIIQPLYLTATHCRHRLIRRKALQLLKQIDQLRHWDTRILVACAAEVIQYEESAAGFPDSNNARGDALLDFHFSPEEQQETDLLASLIPPHARLCEAEADTAGPEIRQGYVRVVLKRNLRMTTAVPASAPAPSTTAPSTTAAAAAAAATRCKDRNGMESPHLHVVGIRIVPLGT